ncbi:MAG: MalY/PatB family protein [Gemmiger sp.]
MKYDFATLPDRTGRDALAVDMMPYDNVAVGEGFSKIPMWVADMNFATAPSVTDALARRVQHPVFGYFRPRQEYYEAILRWQRARNGTANLTARDIGYENGVLGGVVSALNVLCSKGDKVLLHSPTYIGFTHTLEDNGYRIVHSPLYRDADGMWRMDYADMERRIQAEHIHAAVFCSPHNPCGRVWERSEIEAAMEVFRRNDVYVISDEIWSDLLLNGARHVPTQSVSEDARLRTIALYAPSKTFNLAGLVGSYHIVYNDWLRERLNRESSLSHYNSMNVLSMHALIGAYSPEGAEWVDELCEVLSGNINFAYDFIAQRFSGVTLAKPQGTYMLFLDCEEWCAVHEKTLDELLHAGVAVGVIWQDGRPFGGKWSIRMNLALPRATVEQAFDRLDRYVFNAQN